ncbi:MAG: hypothetical protein KDA20_02390 [Phycisphaerales bacterium]|nr:hypothetical protein [Phycisphaerales bacterium]
MNSMRGQSVCRAAHAFTLLEAVIALALMTMILVASLELRVQAMRTGAQVGEACRAARPLDALHTMLINRALPDPIADPETGQPVWSGDFNGQQYVITRVREQVDNPISQVTGEANAPAMVSVWRYTMTIGDEKATFLWYR